LDHHIAGRSVVVFDLDGTLLDSDAALLAPFAAMGIDLGDVRMGSVVGAECARLGVDVDDYVTRYDTEVVQPFDGVGELLAGVGRWAVCSNKHPRSGHAELARLGWHPEVAMFTDAFDGGPKAVAPVLAALGVDPDDAVFVGDTAHDRATASTAGVPFVLAGWNPRAEAADGDIVVRRPQDLLTTMGLA
jgi:phosphoglycolate phosphatase-like HAD superfamily hydrolase